MSVATSSDVAIADDQEQQSSAFKYVVVSREIANLRRSPQIKLDPDNDEQIATDIQKFIQSRVQEFSILVEFDDNLRRWVESVLLKRAGGTFLWVGLVRNELLKKRTCVEVGDTLCELPKRLPAMYGRILRQIVPKQRPITYPIPQ